MVWKKSQTFFYDRSTSRNSMCSNLCHVLKEYLNDIAEANLSDEEQVTLLGLAIKMIEADNQILYSEVKFFKKIRNRLPVSDGTILDKYGSSRECGA